MEAIFGAAVGRITISICESISVPAAAKHFDVLIEVISQLFVSLALSRPRQAKEGEGSWKLLEAVANWLVKLDLANLAASLHRAVDSGATGARLSSRRLTKDAAKARDATDDEDEKERRRELWVDDRLGSSLARSIASHFAPLALRRCHASSRHILGSHSLALARSFSLLSSSLSLLSSSQFFSD